MENIRQEPVRLTIELSTDRVKEIEALMARCRISTKKELFNNALTLFEWAVRESSRGNQIASVNEREQKYRELQMPTLAAAASSAAESIVCT